MDVARTESGSGTAATALSVPLVEAAVQSLYADELKPWGWMLRTRCGEMLGQPVDFDKLRRVAKSSPRLNFRAHGGKWWVMLADRAASFVDFKSAEDPFLPETWDAFVALMAGSWRRSIPRTAAGHFPLACALHRVKLPFLAGLSLGRVCHLVELAGKQGRFANCARGRIEGKPSTSCRKMNIGKPIAPPMPKVLAKADVPVLHTFIHFCDDGSESKRHHSCPWDFLASVQPDDSEPPREAKARNDVDADASTDAGRSDDACSADRDGPQDDRMLTDSADASLLQLRRRGLALMRRLDMRVPCSAKAHAPGRAQLQGAPKMPPPATPPVSMGVQLPSPPPIAQPKLPAPPTAAPSMPLQPRVAPPPASWPQAVSPALMKAEPPTAAAPGILEILGLCEPRPRLQAVSARLSHVGTTGESDFTAPATLPR